MPGSSVIHGPCDDSGWCVGLGVGRGVRGGVGRGVGRGVGEGAGVAAGRAIPPEATPWRGRPRGPAPSRGRPVRRARRQGRSGTAVRAPLASSLLPPRQGRASRAHDDRAGGQRDRAVRGGEAGAEPDGRSAGRHARYPTPRSVSTWLPPPGAGSTLRRRFFTWLSIARSKASKAWPNRASPSCSRVQTRDRLLGERGEEVELGPGQLHSRARAPRLARRPVDHEVAEGEALRAGRGAPLLGPHAAQHGADPGDDSRGWKGLVT